MTDEGRFRDVSIETLTTFFDGQVEKLVNRGVPPDRVVDALKLVVIRTEILHYVAALDTLSAVANRGDLRHGADALEKLAALAKRLKALAEGRNGDDLPTA
jgi:hypothetical protein